MTVASPSMIKEKIIKDSITIDTMGYYLVVRKNIFGSREFSDFIPDRKTADQIFIEYCDISCYFGGGWVDMYYCTKDGFEIIKSKNCF